MQRLLLILLFVIIACKKDKAGQSVNSDTKVTDTSTDTLPPVEETFVVLDDAYFAGYTEDLLDNYRQWFNEINDAYVISPEIAFEKLQHIPEGEYEVIRNRFTSETGEDSFYTLYGYFLKEKNKSRGFEKERENVLNLFRYINRINSRLQYGGTFFGHQEYRLYAHAEYALHQFADNEWLVKKYDIGKQKKLFLDSIRQRVLDEEEYDNYTLGNAKLVRRKEIFGLIDKMDKLITNFFYLKVAQEFQYANYL